MRQAALAVWLATAMLAGSHSAHADPPTQGAEVRLFSLRANGLAADYERLLTTRVSALAGLGLRSSASGDYSGLASTLSLGARFWLNKRGWAWLRAPLGGPYAETYLDLQRTSIRDDVDNQYLDSTYTFATGLGLGFRAAIAQRVSITLHTSLSYRVDTSRGDGNADARRTMRYGLRLGILF